jgi:hypothetical protein
MSGNRRDDRGDRVQLQRTRRWFPGLVGLLLVLGAAPAFARSTLDKERVPADTEVELVVQAPVEEPGAYNERVIVEVPDGFSVRPCVKPPEGFRCFIRPAANPPRTLVVWEQTEEPDVAVPFSTDELPFRTRSHPKLGSYKFVITQLYSNGEESRWDGPPGSANPAPVLVVEPGPGTPPTTSTTSPDSSTTSAPPGSVSSTSVPLAPPTTAAAPPPAPSPGSGPAGATSTTIRAALDVIEPRPEDEGPSWLIALTGAALLGGAGALVARAAGRRRLID